MKIPCSVPVLTLNVKQQLERLLPVLHAAFDDVFIVDGNSTDGTQAFAGSLGVRVERQFDHDIPNSRITDFTAARLRSWSGARHDWIFIIDADELPSPELMTRINSLVTANDAGQAHRFSRLAQLPDGRIVERAFFYPERTMIRLFNRKSGISLVHGRLVHERFVIPPNVDVVMHDEALIHVWPEPDNFKRKLEHYVSLEYHEATGGWSWLARWVVWYNLRTAVGQMLRSVFVWFSGALRGQTVLPWAYTWPMIAYRFRAMRKGLGVRLGR